VILHNLELANIYSIDGDINKGWQWSQQDPITDLSDCRLSWSKKELYHQ